MSGTQLLGRADGGGRRRALGAANSAPETAVARASH